MMSSSKSSLPWQGLLAGWLTGWVMLLAYTPLFPDSPLLVFSVVPPLAGFLSGTVAAFFPRIDRTPRPGWLREIGLGLILTAGFGLGAGMILAASGEFGLVAGNLPAALGALVLASAAFLVGRVFTAVWQWWGIKRRQRLLFGMIHSHLVVAAVVAGLTVAAGIGWIGYSIWQDQEIWNSLPNPGYSLFAVILLWTLSVLLISAAVFLAVVILLLPLSFLLSYAMARRVTRRVEGLSRAAGEMERGNLAVSTPVEGEDEVAHLQAVFNTMARSLRESSSTLQEEKNKVATLLDAQRSLTAGASHELRTPVAVLSGYLESILEHWQEKPAEELKSDLGIISREVDDLRGLVDDLFILESAQLRRLSFESLPVEPGEAVRQVVRALAPAVWYTARVELTADVPRESRPIQADPLRLSQILKNLVVNAARHTPPGGFICVSAGEEPDAMWFEVADSGEGIPAGALARIWEPFYKVDAASEGAGLGLALVREFTEMMGGSASVRSKPGQGTVFSIRFPLKKTSL
jgi:signal transduction histidine kinase